MPPALPKRLAAEVVGTFGFFFTGFCGIAAFTTQGPSAILSIGIAAGFGFGLALMIFAFGLFIFTAATVCGPITGGSFNPARSITPALIDGTFTHLWVYIVGPLAGGALGGLVNSLIRESDPEPAAT